MKKWTTLAALAILGAGAASFALSGQNTSAAPSSTGSGPHPARAASASTVSFDQKIAPLALLDTSGKPVTVGDWDKSKATVLMFVATQCPVSNAYNTRMAALSKTYGAKGVRFVGINSNKAEGGSEVASHSKDNGFDFAVLKDPQNKIADRFDAKVTPEIYVVGPKGDLLYKGRIDNSQNQAQVNDKSLQKALDAILSGKSVTERETRAFGCSIKREG